MTTAIVPRASYYGSINTDAEWRAWGTHVNLVLSTAGLIQTADTGQINWTTTVRTGSGNTDVGYEIWRFNDAQQGTDPIFIKLLYGTGGNSNRSRIRVQIGQGSNGAGTLTGQLSSILTTGGGWAEDFSTWSVSSYGCHTTGFFGMHIAPGTNVGTPRHSFSISRTRDVSGAFDGLGAVIWYDNSSTAGTRGAIQFVRWLNNAYTGAATDHYCIAVGVPGDTALLSGDKQLYPHFYADPSVKSAWAHFTIRNNEIAAGITPFSAAPMYAETRTFLHLGQDRNPVGESTYNTNFRYVMLWE